MCAKKQQIVLSPKEAARTDTSYERMMNRLHYTGKPTYRFEIGDEVSVGYLPNCRVLEKLESKEDLGPVQRRPWTKIRNRSI